MGEGGDHKDPARAWWERRNGLQPPGAATRAYRHTRAGIADV